MIELYALWHGFRTLSLSLDNASILARVKEGYLVWVNILPHIPKSGRYTLGARIENKFIDLLELSYTSYFSEKERKSERLAKCIFTMDILKFLITVAWEAKLISHKQYEDIALKMDEVGKMFWGWRKSLDPQKTAPDKRGKK